MADHESTSRPQCHCKPKCLTPSTCCCVYEQPALMLPLRCSACGLRGYGYLPISWPFVRILCACGAERWFARRDLPRTLALRLAVEIEAAGLPASKSLAAILRGSDDE